MNIRRLLVVVMLAFVSQTYAVAAGTQKASVKSSVPAKAITNYLRACATSARALEAEGKELPKDCTNNSLGLTKPVAIDSTSVLPGKGSSSPLGVMARLTNGRTAYLFSGQAFEIRESSKSASLKAVSCSVCDGGKTYCSNGKYGCVWGRNGDWQGCGAGITNPC